MSIPQLVRDTFRRFPKTMALLADKQCARCGGWGQSDPSGQGYEVRLCPECPGAKPRWPSDPKYQGTESDQWK